MDESTAETADRSHHLWRYVRRYWPVTQPWLGTGARVILGVVFITAGWLKVGDLAESGRSVNAYEVMPIELGRFVGAVLPFIEIAIGALLIIGLSTRLVAFLNGGIYLIFITGIAQAWARGLTIDCGCFGGGGQVDAADTRYATEIARDILLVSLTAFLVMFPHTKYSLDARLAGPEEIE
ncbi:MAG: DoxX family membrane protein [Dactylosporangium sp.]|nr:DoxX family membrane protein [Dactylosporangium sp.]NNJ62573.1 DoxX family membrane protein [Dactylosporangium sp.]